MRHYDYGTSCRTLLDTPRPCNQAVYGQLVPPVYNLTAIENQLVLFTGGLRCSCHCERNSVGQSWQGMHRLHMLVKGMVAAVGAGRQLQLPNCL
jgi:hypothetical protein